MTETTDSVAETPAAVEAPAVEETPAAPVATAPKTRHGSPRAALTCADRRSPQRGDRAGASDARHRRFHAQRPPPGELLPNKVHQQLVREPLVVTERADSYDVIANLRGGGITGQAGALRLGVARAPSRSTPMTVRPQEGRLPDP